MRLLSVLFLALNIAAPAVAGGPVVVELFTSQGCSSCPPADDLLIDLAANEDVIALGWHVDYWDYLGWKDAFSRPENTTRQMGYRDRWNLRSLYTPQMVIHGESQMVGSSRGKVKAAIANFQAEMPMLDFVISVNGATANARVSPLNDHLPAAQIFLVRVLPNTDTAIPRGENAGKTIAYANIVEEMVFIADWDGRSAIDVSGLDVGEGRNVLLIQAKDFGPILGAQYLR